MIKLMVATDLSERSQHAVQRAVQMIRRQGGGEWALVHVVDDEAPAVLVQQQIAQAEALLQARAEELAALAGSRPKVVVSSGDAPTVIVDAARGLGADLLLLGAHRLSALRDLFVGTTLERVVRSSHLPVLRVSTAVAGEYQHALLAADTSPTGLLALQRARELELLPELDVACAVEPIAAGAVMEVSFSAEVLDNQCDVTRQQLSERLQAADVVLPAERLRVEVGSADAVVGRALKESGADLLILGTHARAGLSRFVLGSVASRLLASQNCDALVVPPVA